ncbi:MAG: hypothetical protein ACYC5X_08010, partial [Syntrophales bacterium]
QGCTIQRNRKTVKRFLNIDSLLRLIGLQIIPGPFMLQRMSQRKSNRADTLGTFSTFSEGFKQKRSISPQQHMRDISY